MRVRQSPRTPGVTTPRAEDERSGADDTTEDVAFADENESLNPATEPPTTGKKKRGSPQLARVRDRWRVPRSSVRFARRGRVVKARGATTLGRSRVSGYHTRARQSRSMHVVSGEWEASAERGRVREGSDGGNGTGSDLREG